MCQSYLEIKAPHDMRHERDVDRVERGDVGWGVLPDVWGAILREIGLTQARKSPRSGLPKVHARFRVGEFRMGWQHGETRGIPAGNWASKLSLNEFRRGRSQEQI